MLAMRLRFLCAVIAFAVFVQADVVYAQTAAAASEGRAKGRLLGAADAEYPGWFKQSFLAIEEDVADANAAGKHVLLFFDLEGCPYCYKMIEENFKHAPYSGFLQRNFDVIAIDIKGDREVTFSEGVSLTEKEFARHLQVHHSPTILFLDDSNRPVLRLNGYRSVASFKHALDFVHEKAYLKSNLSEYIEARLQKPVYTFRQHPNFITSNDLSQLSTKPLALIFEDASCDECDGLYTGVLSLAETQSILDKFTVVRLDAFSDAPLIDVNGRTTTPKALAAELAIDYRPGIVLFDKGREIHRIDSMLHTFHFQLALRYVGERHYQRYPRFRDYSYQVQESILNSGQDIDIGK